METVFDNPSFDQHEQVSAVFDAETGLRGFIAVHSTARGPAAGGTRLWHYDNTRDALTDALRLSRGMSYKNAMADLPLGGGKAVIMTNGPIVNRQALFEAYGRMIERLGGTYITAEDVGVGPEDMRHVARFTRHVAGLTEGKAASGDPSPVTARGVFEGLRIAVQRKMGVASLKGVRVGVQGLGHVGTTLCQLLARDGARLIVTDVNATRIQEVCALTGAEKVDPGDIYSSPMDVFAPCALGAVIDHITLPQLQCQVIAGAANNQLADHTMDHALHEAGILYAPDYVINGGGIINVAAEIRGDYDPKWVDGKLNALVDTLDDVFKRAAARNLPTGHIADEMAEARLQAARMARLVIEHANPVLNGAH